MLDWSNDFEMDETIDYIELVQCEISRRFTRKGKTYDIIECTAEVATWSAIKFWKGPTRSPHFGWKRVVTEICM